MQCGSCVLRQSRSVILPKRKVNCDHMSSSCCTSDMRHVWSRDDRAQIIDRLVACTNWTHPDWLIGIAYSTPRRTGALQTTPLTIKSLSHGVIIALGFIERTCNWCAFRHVINCTAICTLWHVPDSSGCASISLTTHQCLTNIQWLPQ